ncbi:MAG: DUF2252 domain-containing protein [Caldilineales bacterium]|nr:DUF2252 domain-containing protein [Caldilineales bacterium]
MTAAIVPTKKTLQERMEHGKEMRAKFPRENHAAWEAPAERADPLQALAAQAETRIPELVPIRHWRMMASPFAFYRGAAAIMAADLAAMPNTGIRVQLCGDAHLSNFGGFASPERELVLDVNDFDETLPGPFEWDVKRLAASIEIVGRQMGINDRHRSRIVEGAVGEYHRAIQEFAELGYLDMWCLHLDPAGMEARWGMDSKARSIKALEANLTLAHGRDNQRAVEKLTEEVNGRLRIKAKPPLIVPIEELASDINPDVLEETIRSLLQTYSRTLQDDRRYLLDHYKYIHMARKVVGVGSVGTRTYIVLLTGRDPTDPLFLQVKEAEASVLEPFLGKSVYAEHGKRVVEGQRLMQAASDIFLGWERVSAGLDGKSHDFYIRQLWDWKISLEVETMTPDEIMIYGKMCGWTLARAHARSGDRIAISAYLGKNASFQIALAEFAKAYADQNQRDYQSFVNAVNDGRLNAVPGA